MISSSSTLDEAAHAAHMNAMYRHQRHIYDTTRKYYLLGRNTLITRLNPPANGCVLEIGCGTGRNLIAVAQLYPDVKLYGIDISEAMLETAQTAIIKAGLTARIKLAQGDATIFDAEQLFGISAFDRIFFSYTLSMIPSWRAAVRHAFGSVAAGGELHIVDFGQQENLPRFFRRSLRWWLNKFSVEPVADLHSELTTLGATIDTALKFETLYRGYAWIASLRKFPQS